jgi:hypothetical protein
MLYVDQSKSGFGARYYGCRCQSRFTITGISQHENQLPKQIELYNNYPNPFNPTTNIPFYLPSRSATTLKIFDALGKEVAVLVNKELPAGSYTYQWNAGNKTSGVYFYQLQAGTFTETKKLLLLR